MIETAAKAVAILDRKAVKMIIEHLDECRNPDGGWQGRHRISDLYYTLFGISAKLALNSPIQPETHHYLNGFENGDGLDFVHFATLLRCRKLLASEDPESNTEMSLNLENFRTRDGAYNRAGRDAEAGSIYDTFLACQARVGKLSSIPHPERLQRFMNQLSIPENTPTTVLAAALLLARITAADSVNSLTQMLLSKQIPQGGFAASTKSHKPDLLALAVSLFAVRAMAVDEEIAASAHLRFIRSLWHSNGGFGGHSEDTGNDCEYSFYALLAMGCLAELKK